MAHFDILKMEVVHVSRTTEVNVSTKSADCSH